MSDYENILAEKDRTISVDEARRRMPTLQRIQNQELRQEVRELTCYAPEYFWYRPGSYEGYHNGERYGLWHHTLKLSTAIDICGESMLEAGTIVQEDLDNAHAAAIVHDQWKNGANPDSGRTHTNHAEVAAVVAEQHGLNPYICDAILTHMGPWDENPEPSGTVETLVHTADLMASDDDVSLAIYGPCPNELMDIVDSTRRLPDDG